MKILLLIFLPLILCGKILAYSDQQKDDLNEAHQLIDSLNNAAWELYRYDLQRAEELVNRSLQLSNEIDYTKGQAYAYNTLGLIHYNRGELQKSHDLNMKALPLARKDKDSTILSRVFSDHAVDLDVIGQKDRALEYYIEALDICPDGAPSRIVLISNLTLFYLDYGSATSAMKYMDQIDSIYLHDPSKSTKAVALLLKAIINYQVRGNTNTVSWILQASELAKEDGDYFTFLECYAEMINICWDLEQTQHVKELLRVAYKYKDKDEFNHFKPAFLLTEAELLYEEGKFEEAIELLRFFEETEDIIPSEKLCAYQLLAEIHEKKENYRYALEAYIKSSILQDSIFNEQTLRKINEIEYNANIAKQELRNKELNNRQLEQKVKIKNLTFRIAILSFLLIASILAAFYSYRRSKEKKLFNLKLKEEVKTKTASLQSANEELKIINEELEGFTHIASHDLKEPLSNILSFLELVDIKHPSESNEQYLRYIKSNAIQLQQLIVDLREFTKVKDAKVGAMSHAKLDDIIENVLLSLKAYIAERQGIIKYKDLPKLYTSVPLLFIIMKNLIQNGLKYNESTIPTIIINHSECDEFHKISISDNGIGIENKYHEQIFNMFSRLHNHQEYEGSGLGLSIVKRSVAKLKGEVEVASIPGKGTTFILKLPRTNIL